MDNKIRFYHIDGAAVYPDIKIDGETIIFPDVNKKYKYLCFLQNVFGKDDNEYTPLVSKELLGEMDIALSVDVCGRELGGIELYSYYDIPISAERRANIEVKEDEQ